MKFKTGDSVTFPWSVREQSGWTVKERKGRYIEQLDDTHSRVQGRNGKLVTVRTSAIRSSYGIANITMKGANDEMS